MLQKLRANSHTGGDKLLQVISDCQKGDPEACRQLYDLFFSTIVANILAVYRHFTNEETEDIIQDTFYRIFTSGIFKYDPARANPHTFFGVIARNAAKKFLSRRKFTEELIPDDSPDDSPENSPENSPDDSPNNKSMTDFPEDSILNQILNDLDNPEKKLIGLRYIDGLILKDIAAIYQVDISTIHRRIKKIRKKIRSTQKYRFFR